MNKIKLVKKNNKTEYVFKLKKGQVVSDHEINLINNQIDCFVNIRIENKYLSKNIIFDITGYLLLTDFLKMTINKDGFINLLRNIVENLTIIKNAFLSIEHVYLEIDKVLVNPMTQKVLFIYVPIQPFETETSLKKFLLDLGNSVNSSFADNNTYIMDYINRLQHSVSFSMFELEQFIQDYSKITVEKKEKIECYKCHTIIDKGTNYCPKCGTKLTGNTGTFSEGIYNPVKEEIGTGSDTVAFGASSSIDPNPTISFEDIYGVVQKDGYLVRVKTKQKFKIDRNKIRIGSFEKKCDLVISDNRAVSRYHADIIKEEDRYFVVDNSSTNYTYVDGMRIVAGEKVEIFNESKIIFADEEFEFVVE